MSMLTDPGATRDERSPAARHGIAWAFSLLLILSLTSCDGILEVSTPGQVPAEALDDPALASALTLSAVGDFECAFANYAGGLAILTNELINATGFLPQFQWDLRNIPPTETDYSLGTCDLGGWAIFTPLQTARLMAEEHYERVTGFSDEEVTDKERQLATLAVYAGYSYVLLGEGFCEMTVGVGPILTRNEVFELAEERFTTAMPHAQQAGADDLLDLARVGRARARLNMGRLSEAASDAEAVTEGFVYYVTRSGTDFRRWNKLARRLHDDFFLAVAPEYRDLEFNGMPDPRVDVFDAGRLGNDGRTPLWLPRKYQSIEDDMFLARWEEAQLIIAEARGGQEAVDIINRLHAQVGLPPFESTDEDEILAQVLEERRRLTFLDGHRQGEMLRHNIPYPTGANHKGQPYGETTCLPLPQVERDNNPNV